MKFLVLSVACLVVSAVSLPTTNRQRRDILPGDPRYGTDYHHHHHHHDNHNVQVVKSVGDFAGSYNSPSPVYGPPGYQPSTPVNSAEPTFELPSIQVNHVKPVIPSTNYGVPVQQNHNNHHEHHYEQHQQHQEHHEQQQQQQHFQQYHFEHHYQQPQQHIQVEQQRQELRYTPQVSYGPPATVRAAPVPVKAPVTSYGTPVENHVQNTYVPVVHARAPQPKDYSIQIYKSQPVKINFQPQPVHSHPQPTNNGYHYHPQPAPQPTQETSKTYLAPVEKKPTVNYQPQPTQPTNNGYHYHPQPAPQPAPRPTPQPSQPTNNGYHYHPQPAPRPTPQPSQPTNNGYHYHPQPAPQPIQPTQQPTNNGYHYPQPTQKPSNTYLAPVEKKPAVNYQPQPAPQPTNTYLTPVIEEKKAPVNNYHPQPNNQYLTPIEQKPEVPETKAVSSYAVHDTEAEEKPTGFQFPSFPQFEFPELPQFEVPELPQFPASDFQQFNPSQILSDAVSSVSDSFSGYVNQKPAQPEATTEKDRTFEHNEPTQQIDDNGGYVY